MRECSYLLLIYRSVPDARRRAVFNMARNRTRVTANTSVEINNHPPVWHRSSSPLRGCAKLKLALWCHAAHAFSGKALVVSTGNLKTQDSRTSFDAMRGIFSAGARCARDIRWRRLNCRLRMRKCRKAVRASERRIRRLLKIMKIAPAANAQIFIPQ